MELDELKKSWNALNEQLQKEPIADEQQITELIAGYKANTRKSLGRLVVIQRFSIGMGAVGLAALLLIWLLLPTFGFNEQLQGKIVALLGFIAISILIGMWWDWKTYRWNKDTRIDEMGVAEVSRRMTTFRQWTRYEVMGISIWIILFNILNYWVMEYHLAPASVQALLITLFVVFDALIIYILYKKVARSGIITSPEITLVFILFLLIPDLYIYLVYVVRKTRKAVLHCLYWLPTLLLAAGYVYFIFLTGDNAMSNHTQAIGRLAITIMLFVFPKTIFMLCSLVGVLAHFIIRRCPRSPFTAIGLVLAVVSFFNILYGTLAGITRFDTKEVEYRSANIPEGFDGYRIVQISDIHIGSWQGNPEPIKQLVDLVNGQKPDLIVFTGDLVNQQSHELDGFQEILSQLYAPDGVYSILGNHDYGSYYHWQSPKAEIANLDYLIRQQKAMGWKLLNNEHDILHHKGDSIALIGVENDGEPPFSQFADLPQAMQGTEGMFQILLSHNPTHWRREVLPQSDISLMLAGHTHAMQGILFGHSLAELIYPEWRGMYYEGKRALYVNIGIGYVGLPFRFGAWPEITVLKLVREKE